MKELLTYLKERFTQLTQAHYEHFLQPELADVQEGQVTLSALIRPEHSNVLGYVHGGVFAGLVDVAMALACLSLHTHVVTTEMNLTYIRNVKVGETITVKGMVINKGRQLVRTRAEAYGPDGTLLVSATGTFFITGPVTKTP